MPELTKVKLIQCGRRSCSYVLDEDERAWEQHPEWEDGKVAVCPICGQDDFFTLKPNGQKVRVSEMDEYRDGIDPNLIEPTPRMGPKMKAYLRDAKRRIMHRLQCQ